MAQNRVAEGVAVISRTTDGAEMRRQFAPAGCAILGSTIRSTKGQADPP